jgi:hypothetical protein
MAEADLPRLAAGSVPGLPELENVVDPIGVPTWVEVLADQAAELPFRAIGRVRILRGSIEQGQGTAWLASANTIVTAAHVAVFFGRPGIRLELVLPGLEVTEPVLEAKLPPAFAGTPFDPWDVGVLRLSPASRRSLPRAPGTAVEREVRLVGFPDAVIGMVVGSGAALLLGQVLLHRADTLVGHSGAPVLATSGPAAGRAIGVHVGNFNVNPHADQHPRHNVALALRPELEEFVAGAIAAWG